MKLPKIVGVAGTNGSGKDTLGRLLHELLDYKNISLSDILRAELDRLVTEATNLLAPWGARSGTLAAAAHFVAERRR